MKSPALAILQSLTQQLRIVVDGNIIPVFHGITSDMPNTFIYVDSITCNLDESKDQDVWNGEISLQAVTKFAPYIADMVPSMQIENSIIEALDTLKFTGVRMVVFCPVSTSGIFDAGESYTYVGRDIKIKFICETF